MSAFPLLSLLAIVVRVLISASRAGAFGGKPGSAPSNVPRGRWIVAAVGGTIWGLFGLITLMSAWLSVGVGRPGWVRTLAVAIVWTSFYAGVTAIWLLAWPILRALARRGRPRLVWALAYARQLFFLTGETGSAATLLAALALAHRGEATDEELAWLRRGLDRQRRFLGTWGTASAFVSAIEAHRRRQNHDLEGAAKLDAVAHGFLGTMTYFSKLGVPAGVRSLGYEYLALAAAKTAKWGGVHVPPDVRPSPVHRALYEWAAPRLLEQPAIKKRSFAPRAKQTPLHEALATRAAAPRRLTDAKGAQESASRVLIAIAKREPVSPRATLNALVALDILTHPEAPDSQLSPEIRGDPAAVAALHDDLASAVATSLLEAYVPFHALPRYGPVSARVYQKVESGLYAEWARLRARVESRRESYERRSGYEEWLQVSELRVIYRRIEYCLGEGAAARLWPEFARVYGWVGVRLSEHLPRLRPLAHAVFACIAREAARFQDAENIRQQEVNMRLTSGID